MKWRGVNELREMYLSFFESKNHTRMASASLIPQQSFADKFRHGAFKEIFSRTGCSS